MNILVACECSGRVRDAFIAQGHDAWSCDLQPSDTPGPHIQEDVLSHLNDGWDMMLAFPPCTDICVSGAAHFEKKRSDGRQQAAIEFFMEFVHAPIDMWAIENPVGIMSRHYRKPDQIIQPWQFGDSYQKTTCLWIKNMERLVPTDIVDPGEFTVFDSGAKMPRWFADTWRLSNAERAKVRSKTFPGIAAAMADQWPGKPLPLFA